MPLLRSSHELTYAAAEIIVKACMAKATEIGVPQCIAVVDTGGNTIAFARMDGAKFLSQFSATQKAITSASIRNATGGATQEMGVNLALATEGQVTNLKGGLPILRDGQLIGAVGVGSGTGEQDVEVGKAGIEALEKALAADK